MMTTPRLRIYAALLAAPDRPHYSWELRRATGVRLRVLTAILWRMHEQGWLSDGWENMRSGRRYYILTDLGKARISAALLEG